uniref:RING-type domain-containing protein n=2 Tax=Kalmanozyma brasiliensis (strain GHG001) TaxID=1365824 RepID=V5ERT0_KALBG
MLDEWMAGDVHGPLLRMAIESEALASNPHLRQLHLPPASSTSSLFGHAPHLALDARNFIADEEWAELNSYEGLMQLSERLGAADVGVPQSLIDALPTCEYGKWDGGSCRLRDSLSPPLLGKGKGKQKVEPPSNARDTMCPICREDYLDSDLLMSIDKCCHAFHADCIKTWFQTAKTCPLCRADAFDRVSLPALPFQSSSSAVAAAARNASPGSAPSLWSFDF